MTTVTIMLGIEKNFKASEEDLLYKGIRNLISLLKLSIKRFIYLKFIIGVASKVSIVVKF